MVKAARILSLRDFGRPLTDGFLLVGPPHLDEFIKVPRQLDELVALVVRLLVDPGMGEFVDIDWQAGFPLFVVETEVRIVFGDVDDDRLVSDATDEVEARRRYVVGAVGRRVLGDGKIEAVVLHGQFAVSFHVQQCAETKAELVCCSVPVIDNACRHGDAFQLLSKGLAELPQGSSFKAS